MKVLISVLSLASMLTLTSGCGSSSGTDNASNTGRGWETSRYDSSEVAEARQKLLEIVDKVQADTEAKLEADKSVPSDLRQKLVSALNKARNKIATVPASTVEELLRLGHAEISNAFTGVLDELAAEMTAKIPPRVGSEPLAGERRDLKDASGNCSNDAVVDFSRYAVKAVKVGGTITALVLTDLEQASSAKLKQIIEPLVTDCFELVDRYGETGFCTNKITASPETIDLAKVKDSCETMRDKIKEF